MVSELMLVVQILGPLLTFSLEFVPLLEAYLQVLHLSIILLSEV